MKLYHIEYKNPIVFGRSQRSFGVKLNNKLGQLSYLVFGCTTLSKGDFIEESKFTVLTPVTQLRDN